MRKTIIMLLCLMGIVLVSGCVECTEAGYKKSVSPCCENLITTQEDTSVSNKGFVSYCTFEQPNFDGECITAGNCFHVMSTEKECCDGLEFIPTSKSTGCCVYGE